METITTATPQEAETGARKGKSQKGQLEPLRTHNHQKWQHCEHRKMEDKGLYSGNWALPGRWEPVSFSSGLRQNLLTSRL